MRINIDKFNVEGFEKWLRRQGAEILPVTNEHELIRFRGKQVGVIYKSGKTSNAYCTAAYNAYKNCTKWGGRPLPTPRLQANHKKYRKQLHKRDGDNCFYCLEPLGEDETLEHLLSLTSGGSNRLQNMVLAHEKCNNDMNGKSLVEKIDYAYKFRLDKALKRERAERPKAKGIINFIKGIFNRKN